MVTVSLPTPSTSHSSLSPATVAATPDGGVVAYWTDMREDATFAGVTRKGEDAFFAKIAP